jgi:parallel beta-helix repeat protein
VSAFTIQPAKAQLGTIYIKPDGSISPSTAPIRNVNNTIYTFTGNINDSIVVERGNIRIDGNGHTVQGPGSGFGDGIFLSSANNVTIMNTHVTGFVCGIYLYSSNNTLSGNNVAANYAGIGLCHSYNWLSGNNITGNNIGISSNSSSSNTVLGNNITGNHDGVVFAYCSANVIYHNDFLNNTQQTVLYGSNPNSWDNGYPSGGNYWSNYTGVDAKSGPHQNETGSDGIGDTPYVIGANNSDNYPLMRPWVSFDGQAIHIRADGNVDPSGAPLTRKGGLYTFASNVASKVDGIIIERNNVTLDGAGYAIQGGGNGTGILLSAVANVTVRDARVNGFQYGIWLYWSSSNGIFDDFVTGNYYGIWLFPSSNGNSVDGNNVISNNGVGIYVGPSCARNNVSGNNITANSVDDIYIQNSWLTAVSGNTIAENGVRGIVLENSQDSILRENNVTDNGEGISLIGSMNNSLARNILLGNGENFGVFGETLYDFTQNIDTSNTINGKPIYYWINQTDEVVPQDAGYVGIVNSSNIRVEGLSMSHNDQGILVAFSVNTTINDNKLVDNVYGVSLVGGNANKIVHNTCDGNDYGVGLRYSSRNSLSQNTFSSNSGGILLTYSSNNNSINKNDLQENNVGIDFTSVNFNSVLQNNFTMNQYGLSLDSSFNNKIYHNNFIDNIQQMCVYSRSANNWNKGYPSGGNYWSDYQTKYPNARENDSSAIWKTPYFIDANNTDKYPLMAPFHTFNVSTWNGTAYSVDVVSNSTVSNLSFNATAKTLSFNATGTTGTIGFCRVAIPKDLMWCDNDTQWLVLISEGSGGQLHFFLPTLNIVTDINYTYIYFAYPHSTHLVLIASTHAVPELQPLTLMPLFMIITLPGAMVIRRKRNMKK